MSLYSLAKGVTLQEYPGQPGGTGGTLSLSYPRRIIRLSQGGLAAVKLLCGLNGGPGPNVAGDPVLTEEAAGWKPDEKSASLAAELENQGLLIRNFPALSDDLLPAVSIVIPTYNRQKMLPACIDSLLNMDYPPEKMEIIVVDDASPEPVELTSHPLVRVIRQPENGGPGAARNRAVKEAQGEIIAFLDDDCLADREWLKALVPCFQYPDVAAAGGRVESAALDNPLEKYEQVQSPLLMGAVQRKVRKGSGLSYLATCNLLVRRQSLLAIGGFDHRMRVGEDVDLCWRLLAGGQNIYYVPAGLVYHHHRARFIPFLKRRFNYGQSEAQLQARYPKDKRRLVFFPGNSFILGMVTLMALLVGIWPALAAGAGLIMLNLLWQAVSRLSSIRSAECKPGFRQVLPAMARSQGTAFYLYSQHFARYYSIPAVAAAIVFLPPAAPLILAACLLPGIVDYRLKKPTLGFGRYLFYHFWEDVFYQAGVVGGCLSNRNLRPLAMDFIRADANLLQRLATKN